MAFKWAKEADPNAELYYNDYNLDVDDAKRAKTIELVKYLRESGAPIDGVGLQGHYNLSQPTVEKIDETIRMFAELGVKVMITELDVQAVSGEEISGAVGAFNSSTPPTDAQKKEWRRRFSGPPPALTVEKQQALAERYGEIFRVFSKNREAITRVTFWGLRDADSWRRWWSPLVFDDDYAPKPAYHAVIGAARAK